MNRSKPNGCPQRLLFNALTLLSAALLLGGCARQNAKYKGEGYILKIPSSWKMTDKEDATDKLFLAVSEFKQDIVTFNSPEKDKRSGRPKATISIFSQKFNQPLWVEDITADILDWVRRQGYTILGSGKVNYQGSIGFSVNYRDEKTGVLYLEFYFASDSRVYVVVLLQTSPEDFQFYLADYEAFRDQIEFSLF